MEVSGGHQATSQFLEDTGFNIEKSFKDLEK